MRDIDLDLLSYNNKNLKNKSLLNLIYEIARWYDTLKLYHLFFREKDLVFEGEKDLKDNGKHRQDYDVNICKRI